MSTRDAETTEIRSERARGPVAILGIAVCCASMVALVWFGRVWGPSYVAWLHRVTSGAEAGVASLCVIGGFALGSSVFIPITLLVSAMALAFDPAHAIAYALLGGSLGAALSHRMGAWLGGDTLARLAGQSTRPIAAKLRTNGFRTALAVRFMPVGNFTFFNLLAGSLGVPFWRFVVGSLVGMLPGTIGVTLLVHELTDFHAWPGRGLTLTFSLCAAAFVAVLGALAWRAARRRRARARGPETPAAPLG